MEVSFYEPEHRLYVGDIRCDCAGPDGLCRHGVRWCPNKTSERQGRNLWRTASWRLRN